MLFLIRNIVSALPHRALTAQVLSHDASYIFAAGRDGSVAVLELHVFGSAFESRKQAEKKTVCFLGAISLLVSVSRVVRGLCGVSCNPGLGQGG